MKKFFIIIIDAGWPTIAHGALQRSLKPLQEYLADHHLTILPQEDARDFFKEHPEEIGKDPIILITDTHPKKVRHRPEDEPYGIRIDLGAVTSQDEVVRYLQEVCQLINNEDFVAEVSWEERKKIARVFLKDVVKDLVVRFLELVV